MCAMRIYKNVKISDYYRVERSRKVIFHLSCYQQDVFSFLFWEGGSLRLGCLS